MELVEPKVPAPLDPQFRPAALAVKRFQEKVAQSPHATPLRIALEREKGLISVYETQVFGDGAPEFEENYRFVERLIKTLLWARGGWRVVVGGPRKIGEYIQKVYSPDGQQAFDFEFMGDVYEKPFTVEVCDADGVPEPKEQTVSIGRHLDGCRIGFDAGASDHKVAAVVDGEAVFSNETVWDPKSQSNPDYHYHHVQSALHLAAAHMPRVDCIGVSAAGIYIDNRVRVASLFRGIPKDLFEEKVADMFVRIGQEWGVPILVANDGDVAALAGSMSLEDNAVLGIALGSSEAGGYVNEEGNITGWLNELAFVPIDFSEQAPVEEWSGDRGCGATYLSQQAVFRLCPQVGIELDTSAPLADQLKQYQNLLEAGDAKARQIMETIGVYFGYAVAYYANFYEARHVMIMGRVTSGSGGPIILEKATEVLKTEFPELAEKIQLHLPEEEKARRVGQAFAAATLPALGGD